MRHIQQSPPLQCGVMGGGPKGMSESQTEVTCPVPIRVMPGLWSSTEVVMGGRVCSHGLLRRRVWVDFHVHHEPGCRMQTTVSSPCDLILSPKKDT